MDPLSISASVITVTALVTHLTKTFVQLRRDHIELPGRLIALNNEIADLAVVVADVDATVKARKCLSDEEEVAIPTLLSRAEVDLQDLQQIVDLLADKERSHRILQRATVWRKWHPQLQNIQSRLRETKGALNVLLGASNSRDVVRMRLDLETISRTTSNESDQQSEFREQVSASLESQESLLKKVADSLGTNIERRLYNIEALLTDQYGALPPYSQQAQFLAREGQVVQTYNLLDLEPYPSTFEMKQSMQPIAIQATPRHAQGCPPNCSCRCHSLTKKSSRGYLDTFLGQIFLGYAGVPLISPACDLLACQHREGAAISVEYWFPIGFCWSQIVRLELAYRRNLGPEWQLKTMRRVPDSALCVKYALDGNVDGLKELFRSGLASPRDVSNTRGYTLLRWALYGQKYEACRFLLAAGSDPDYKPVAASDDCPSDKACDIILRGNIPSEVEQIMRLISRGSDFIDDQNFSRLHKMVLGLMFGDLKSEILSQPDQIDVTDALGRTPLEWAAARGDNSAIVLLLSFGANPNVMDKKLNTPLTLASNQGHTVAVRLLLEAGASPDPILPAGIKFGTPLNCAARNAKDPILIKLLLDFDANVEACGVDGVTPLLHVARSKPPSFARLLLDYGADINAHSKDGRTALTIAIIHNNHGVLQLLLDRWFEYTACPRLKGPHLLELAARHANMQTISVLANAKHLKLRRDDSYALQRIQFQSYLRERLDFTEDLASSFDNLVEIILWEQPATRRRTWWSSLAQSSPDGLERRDLEKAGISQDSLDSPAEQEFVDASETLVLKTDDLTPLLKRRGRLADES